MYSFGHKQKLCILELLQEFKEILNERMKWANSGFSSKDKNVKDCA